MLIHATLSKSTAPNTIDGWKLVIHSNARVQTKPVDCRGKVVHLVVKPGAEPFMDQAVQALTKQGAVLVRLTGEGVDCDCSNGKGKPT